MRLVKRRDQPCDCILQIPGQDFPPIPSLPVVKWARVCQLSPKKKRNDATNSKKKKTRKVSRRRRENNKWKRSIRLVLVPIEPLIKAVKNGLTLFFYFIRRPPPISILLLPVAKWSQFDIKKKEQLDLESWWVLENNRLYAPNTHTNTNTPVGFLLLEKSEEGSSVSCAHHHHHGEYHRATCCTPSPTSDSFLFFLF